MSPEQLLKRLELNSKIKVLYINVQSDHRSNSEVNLMEDVQGRKQITKTQDSNSAKCIL